MVIRKGTAIESSREERESGVPTVSEVTRQLQDMLESKFASIVVQGEISGWNRAASGHTYFTLKDERACLSAVLWKTTALPFKATEGMKVIATGKISVYAARGSYQLVCQSLTPVGQGDLQLAFERLKQKLLDEGLFEQEHKKPLPPFPKRIGIVTSRDGAAIRDIITTLRRRMPRVEVLLRSTLVQGAGAAAEIARAIREFDSLANVDLLIVGRGGGSIEDLWAFNEEAVARAIFDCHIPVISAVGHEIDFTISDFVADVRAATPTAAAELAVPHRDDVIGMLRTFEEDLTYELQNILKHRRHELALLLHSRGLSRPMDLIREHQQRLDDFEHRAGLGLRTAIVRAQERVRLLHAKLEALNPENVLVRGFAIIERGGKPVGRAANLNYGDRVQIRMADGVKPARIDGEKRNPNQELLFGDTSASGE